jgi:hypothetical protein
MGVGVTSPGKHGRNVMLTTDLYLVLRSKIVELYIYFLIYSYLHGLVLN